MKLLLSNIKTSFLSNKDNPFLVTNERTLSFKEVSDIADRVSEIISNYKSSENKEVVGVLSKSKVSSILAQLSIINSSNVYTHLNANAPFARNLKIIFDSKIPYLLVCSSNLEKLKQEVELGDHLNAQYIQALDLYLCQVELNNTNKIEDKLCNIIFTSGTTGTAKGIKITYENLLCFSDWASKSFNFHSKDVFCSIAPLHFDLSVFDIYVPLLIGASVFVFESEEIKNPRLINQTIEKEKINIIYSTPTLHNLLHQFGKIERYDFSCLHTIIFAGEQLMSELLNKWKAICPKASYFNFYGPSETNVCTFFDASNWDPNENSPVPIGNACSYVESKLTATTGDNNLLELHIKGQSVFAGYLEDSETSFDSNTWYNTGDLVQKDKDGNLVFVSRNDRMIKLKGYRIELVEIEKCIEKFEHSFATGYTKVMQCKVILDNSQQENRILAFLEIDSDLPETVSKQAIFNHCKNMLPHYMIPSDIRFVSQLPISDRGKIDLKALANW